MTQGDAVQLAFFTEKLTRCFPPVASADALNPILLEMESVVPTGRGDIAQSLEAAAEMVKQRSLVILISDLLQPPAQLALGIQNLRQRRHDVTVFHVLDGAEISLPLHGLVELRDQETGEKLLVEADEIRSDYTRAAQAHLDEVRRICSACGAAYYTIDTRTPMIEALAKRANAS